MKPLGITHNRFSLIGFGTQRKVIDPLANGRAVYRHPLDGPTVRQAKLEVGYSLDYRPLEQPYAAA